MKLSEQNKLLKDILAERDLSTLRENTLESGLVALRHHRQRRRARRTLSLAALPLLLISAAVIVWNVRALRLTSNKRQPASPLAVAQKQNSAVRVITDDELFALFPNRSLALVGKPGHQELVFLGRNSN
jgi:hypothetical protein